MPDTPEERKKLLLVNQKGTARGVTRGSREHNSPGAESLWGRRMTEWGAKKSQPCHKYFLQYSAIASRRPRVQTWGRQTCFLPRAPSDLVASLGRAPCCVCACGTRSEHFTEDMNLVLLFS